jgi:hypothetical protein
MQTTKRFRKDLPTSEKFLRRGQAKRAKGEDPTWWFKAAAIIKRIERGLPVGHHRRRQGRAA